MSVGHAGGAHLVSSAKKLHTHSNTMKNMQRYSSMIGVVNVTMTCTVDMAEMFCAAHQSMHILEMAQALAQALV